MKRSFKIGFSFGLTSGIITTLGLMVGLHSGTGSQTIVIAGILTIAIADTFSESMGIHISQETEKHISKKEIWEATAYTFICKFAFSAMFIIPVLLFDLVTAVAISVLVGLYLIFLLSIAIARARDEPAWKVCSEHLVITAVVILLTHYIGCWINSMCGV
jgi:VIT1/CCC1 family predicted Fe2+/Mn2+ transporter